MANFALCFHAAGFGFLLSLSNPAFAQVEASDSTTEKTEDKTTLGEIIVTGSHIRGAEAAGSKLIVITREQIDASGYGRVEDVLATVTQNFNRGNQAVAGGEEADNYNRGAEVQLRGLGLGTTLTLVNGQRQGASGYQGSFTDISGIPASAVERIEILPEGAAALYGSDAIGGVVNVILRKNFEGFETRVRVSVAQGDARERSFAQLWGHKWSSGHVLVGYQFNDSVSLPCNARAYCAANGDFRPFGGSDIRGVGSNPGTILDPNTFAPIAAIPHGQDGTNLTQAQLVPGANYTNAVLYNDILPQQTMQSAFLSASFNLADQWELSVDGRYSSRDFKSTFPQPANNYFVPATNAFNHLGGPVVVAYDFTRDVGPVIDSGPTDTLSISVGLERALPRGWQVKLASAYSKSTADFLEANTLNPDAIAMGLNSSDPTTALNLFGDGSHTNAAVLASLRNPIPSGLNVFSTTSASVIADGPILSAPAGPIRGAVGGDYRKEHSVGLNIINNAENRGRHVVAGFFELAVPIAASREASTVGRVDLSLAGRYDSYSDVGTTFNPKVGLSWQPLRLIKLRGTWGTSFRAPPFFWTNPDQRGDGAIANVSDPRSPTGQSRALMLYGPAPNLQPETAHAWTGGVDLTPPAVQNLSLSLTYFDIDYRGKIHNPGPFAAVFLTRETEFASLITRNPTRAQIDAVCSAKIGNCNQPIDAILDNRFRNLSSVRTRGVDAALDYSLATARGKWSVGLNGTYTIDLNQQITATAPVFDHVNTVGFPLKLRLVGHVSWSIQRWTAQSTLNYSGAYWDPGSVPARRVASWTTVDFNLGYRVEAGQGWLADTQLNLGLINTLDQRPPFVNQFDLITGTLGYDAANATLLGRAVSLQVVKGWGH